MSKANEIVAEARACLKTPYHHQARKPGVGLDCVGLVVHVGKACGCLPAGYDVTDYSPSPDGFELRRHLDEQLIPIPQATMRPGDVILVAFAKHPQHIGILGDYVHGGLSLIHASNHHDAVVEHRLLLGGAMRFVAAYRFKEL